MKILDFEGVKLLIAEIKKYLSLKQDTEPGKQLSEENFTAEDKEKLAVLSNYNDSEIREEISSVKEQTVLNRSAIGMQKKNLMKNLGKSGTFSGVTFSIDNDGKINASGMLTSQITYFINDTSMTFDRDVIVSRSGTLTNLNLYVRTKAPEASSNEYTPVTESGLLIPAGTAITQVYLQRQTAGTAVSAENLGIMIRYAEIADDIYEPYADDLQTQINQLAARIATLESDGAAPSSDRAAAKNPEFTDDYSDKKSEMITENETTNEVMENDKTWY